MNNPPVEVTFEYPVEVLADTDGDGVPDVEDPCLEDPNKVDPGYLWVRSCRHGLRWRRNGRLQ